MWNIFISLRLRGHCRLELAVNMMMNPRLIFSFFGSLAPVDCQEVCCSVMCYYQHSISSCIASQNVCHTNPLSSIFGGIKATGT